MVTEVPYLDERLGLIFEPERIRVHRRNGSLLVPESNYRPALERWYRRTARTEIATRLDIACARIGKPYTRLSIRDQRTRWASCSAEGAMSFNWRLLLAPEAVLDYIVWHEVCHLIDLSHSRSFWSLVARHCPDYKTHVRWLRTHGPRLKF